MEHLSISRRCIVVVTIEARPCFSVKAGRGGAVPSFTLPIPRTTPPLLAPPSPLTAQRWCFSWLLA